jgi:hypothetical protein
VVGTGVDPVTFRLSGRLISYVRLVVLREARPVSAISASIGTCCATLGHLGGSLAEKLHVGDLEHLEPHMGGLGGSRACGYDQASVTRQLLSKVPSNGLGTIADNDAEPNVSVKGNAQR